MHILHIDLGREMRGGQRQVLMLLEGLRNAGHTSELLARASSPLYHAAEAQQFAVRPATLVNVLTRSRYAEVVHVHDARSHTLAAVGSQRPFVVSRRVAFPVSPNLLSKWKYGRARRFLAVSEFVAGELRRAGVPAAKIDVVYDGVQITTCRAKESAARDQVVALASRDPEKGRDLVEQAAAMAKTPVLFSDHLATDLPGASLFLYITRAEGLGSAALLAMSLELPVIASRVGGLAEIVVDGYTGLLVDNDAAAISEAILKLMGDPEIARALGRNGRTRVEQNFTAKHLVTSTLDSYRRALAG